MASSSSTSSGDDKKKYQYDVFLSFSGEDTRRSFVDHLNEALQRHSIRTFKDDERLEKGKEIKDELLKSIEDSKFCVIVFSKKYASSSWCLDELVKIMECHETMDQTAFPVFYDVEPTEVRNQSGLVGEAFAKHTNKEVVGKTLARNDTEKALAKNSNSRLEKWRKALKDAANLCGWELKNTAHGHEAKVIKLIVEKISLELRSISVGVDQKLVGMEQRMQALDPYLDIGSDDVRLIGIKGMGGAGKSTLARAIFDKISLNFEGTSFVENVRENSKAPLLGLQKLQEQILRDILKDKSIDVSGVYEGTNMMKRMLCGKKVLVVLDDVDHKDQLEALAGEPNWFKSGSRIIVTTRDEQVLIAHRVKLVQDVHLLSNEEAIHLFSRHAFPEDIPPQEYQMKSLDQVVSYAAGLPLIIKVLGSFLCGKDKPEWMDALARLQTIPLKETLQILELSYESLEDDYKEIFLDVACFVRHYRKDHAIRILESCRFHAINGLRVLEQKSLIKIVETYGGGSIYMHDRIVELGENIVRREHPDEPNKHSRLWLQEKIQHVLANNLGTGATKCIDLNNSTPEIVFENIENMRRLGCLIVNRRSRRYYPDYCFKINKGRQYFPNSLQYLYWKGYPHWCLPKTFEANNLVGLEMPHSKIQRLWEGGKIIIEKLKFLNLSDSKKVRSLDLGFSPNLLRLDLGFCTDLRKLDLYGGCLKSLVYLNLYGCSRLKSRVFIKQLESLEALHISGVDTREFSDFIIKGLSNNSLRELHLEGSDIEEVPSSIGNLHKLVSLHLNGCFRLKSLPGSICSLHHLRTLDLWNSGIEELPEDLGQLESLENLDLSGTRVKHPPRSICMLKRLKTLSLRFCYFLEKLPEYIGQLESLEILDLQYCSNLRDIPNTICKLKRLKTLHLGFCSVEKLPEDIGQLESLERLDLENCSNLQDIPNSICKLKRLTELKLRWCERLVKLPDHLGDLECLQLLDIRDSGITQLPQSISLLKGLEIYRSELKLNTESVAPIPKGKVSTITYAIVSWLLCKKS